MLMRLPWTCRWPRFRRRHARMVGMVGSLQETEKRIVCRSLLFRHGSGNAGEGASRALPRCGHSRGVRAGYAELRLIGTTDWLPGIFIFCVIALPWYALVERGIRSSFANSFSNTSCPLLDNLYHHPEPFWYYFPVMAIALLPWIVFAIAALFQSLRVWWAERSSTASEPDPELQFSVFAIAGSFCRLSFSRSRSRSFRAASPGRSCGCCAAGRLSAPPTRGRRRGVKVDNRPARSSRGCAHRSRASNRLPRDAAPFASRASDVRCVGNRIRALCRASLLRW